MHSSSSHVGLSKPFHLIRNCRLPSTCRWLRIFSTFHQVTASSSSASSAARTCCAAGRDSSRVPFERSAAASAARASRRRWRSARTAPSGPSVPRRGCGGCGGGSSSSTSSSSSRSTMVVDESRCRRHPLHGTAGSSSSSSTSSSSAAGGASAPALPRRRRRISSGGAAAGGGAAGGGAGGRGARRRSVEDSPRGCPCGTGALKLRPSTRFPEVNGGPSAGFAMATVTVPSSLAGGVEQLAMDAPGLRRVHCRLARLPSLSRAWLRRNAPAPRTWLARR